MRNGAGKGGRREVGRLKEAEGTGACGGRGLAVEGGGKKAVRSFNKVTHFFVLSMRFGL